MSALRTVLMAAVVISVVFSFTFAAEAPKGDVVKGKALFSNPKLGTTGKSCNDCHMDGKGLEGAAGKKEFFKDKKQMSLEQAVNFCVVNGIKGKKLKGDKLANMVAYIKTFKAGAPAEKQADKPVDKPVEKPKKKIEGC